MARLAIDAVTFLEVARLDQPAAAPHQLVAPNALRSRALELLLAEVRAGALAEAEALRIHERLTELKVRLLGDRVSRRRAWSLARENDWADLRDAEYLAIAQLQADALLTIDPVLRERAAGVVPVASFEETYLRT